MVEPRPRTSTWLGAQPHPSFEQRPSDGRDHNEHHRGDQQVTDHLRLLPGFTLDDGLLGYITVAIVGAYLDRIGLGLSF